MRILNNRPTVIDLFSGAGGFSEGFIQAGFHVLASVEFDLKVAETQKFNHARYKKYKTHVIVEDLRSSKNVISRLQTLEIEKVDVIIGGPPCQGFSRLNLRSCNSHNPLNRLFYKFLNIANFFRPYIIVLENVADLARFENGRITDEIIRCFKEIGYKVEKTILNAVHFGVPQKRNRIFFIGTKDKCTVEFPEPLLSNPDEFVKLNEAISDLPLLTNGASIDSLPYRFNSNLTDYQQRMRVKAVGFVRNNLVTRNNELVLKRYAHIPQGGNWKNIPESLMLNYKDKERCHQWIYRRLPLNEPSITITNFRKNMLIHPLENRGLSVRESARIQSFPDHFVFLGGIGSQQQQVANAVPPLLAKAVASKVKGMLGKLS